MFRQVLGGVDERLDGRDAIALAKHLVAQDGELPLALRARRRGEFLA